MRHYNIGLDFGTFQTKVCINDVSKNKFRFLKFKNTNGFFLPSTITLENDKFIYGKPHKSGSDQFFDYFKIASAEDEEFNFESFTQSKQAPGYKENYRKRSFTPEFLACVYLSNILFEIEANLERKKTTSSSLSSLFSRFVKKEVEENYRMTLQLGIPTEWSQKKNYARKRKFRSILIIAKLLKNQIVSKEEFLNTTSGELEILISNIYKSISEKTEENIVEMMNQEGISVYPETAAGLTTLTRTGQLPPGCYATLDIGGGSTDISFFRVIDENKIKYLASESYLIASNNVYLNFREYFSKNESIENIQNQFHKAIETDSLTNNHYSSLQYIEGLLENRMYKLFNQRVRKYKTSRKVEFDNQEIVLYGGGAKLPIINDGHITIYDNGNKDSFTITRTKMLKKVVSNFNFNSIKIEDIDEVKEHLVLLVVALGLSIIKPDSDASWLDGEEYNSTDFDGPKLTPHPTNEDCYIINPLGRHKT